MLESERHTSHLTYPLYNRTRPVFDKAENLRGRTNESAGSPTLIGLGPGGRYEILRVFVSIVLFAIVS